MKLRLSLVLILCIALITSALLSATALSAENPNNLFLQGYEAVELGLKREREGKLEAAMERYRVAATCFERLKQKFPDWHSSVVDLRIQRTAAMITGLQVSIDSRASSPKKLSAESQTGATNAAGAKKHN